MKLKALTIFLTSVLAFGFAQSQIQPLKWSPITTVFPEGATAYIDVNSYSRKGAQTDKDYSTAVILLEFKKPQEAVIDEEKLVYTSLARQILVDCNSGIVAPYLDYYFDKPQPSRDDVPIAIFKFEQAAENYGQLSKKSALFKTVCAFYI